MARFRGNRLGKGHHFRIGAGGTHVRRESLGHNIRVIRRQLLGSLGQQKIKCIVFRRFQPAPALDMQFLGHAVKPDNFSHISFHVQVPAAAGGHGRDVQRRIQQQVPKVQTRVQPQGMRMQVYRLRVPVGERVADRVNHVCRRSKSFWVQAASSSPAALQMRCCHQRERSASSSRS